MTEAEIRAAVMPMLQQAKAMGTQEAVRLLAPPPAARASAGPAAPPPAAAEFSAGDLPQMGRYFAASDDGSYDGDLHAQFGCGVRAFADHTGLVRKQVDETREGKSFKAWRWVKSEGGDRNSEGQRAKSKLPQVSPTETRVDAEPTAGFRGRLAATAGGRAVLALGGGAVRIAHAVERRLLFAARKTQAVAVEAARRQGMDPDRAERLRKILYVADFLGGYATGAAGLAVAGPVGAKVGAILPTASVAYLMYSTAKNPKATWEAAKRVISSTFAKEQADPPAASHAEFDLPLAQALAASVHRAADPDWYTALLYAALAETGGDLAESVRLADAAKGAARQFSEGVPPESHGSVPHTNEEFVAKIHANPLESTAHYAHADWLRERGDHDGADFRQAMGDWMASVQPNWRVHRPVESNRRNSSRVETKFPWAAPEAKLPEGVRPEHLPRWDMREPDSTFFRGDGTGYWPQDPTHAAHNYLDFRYHTYQNMEEAFRRAFMAHREANPSQAFAATFSDSPPRIHPLSARLDGLDALSDEHAELVSDALAKNTHAGAVETLLARVRTRPRAREDFAAPPGEPAPARAPAPRPAGPETTDTPAATPPPPRPGRPPAGLLPPRPGGRIGEDLHLFRTQVRSKHALAGPRGVRPNSPEELPLLHDFARNRGLKVLKSPVTFYDEDSHTLHHPTPENPAAVAASYLKWGTGRETFAEDDEGEPRAFAEPPAKSAESPPPGRPSEHVTNPPAHFFPEESVRLTGARPETQKEYQSLVNRAVADKPGTLPGLGEVKAVAQVGDAARGGYNEQYRTMEGLLKSPEDARRWVMANAILSAQTGWEDHTAGATEALASWHAAGRPAHPEGLDALFGTTGRNERGGAMIARRGTYGGPATLTGAKVESLKNLFALPAAPDVDWKTISAGSFKTPNFGKAFVSPYGVPIDTHMAKLISPGYTRTRIEAIAAGAGANPAAASRLLDAQKKVIERPAVVMAYKTLLAKAAADLGWDLNQTQEAVWTGALAVMAAMDAGAAPRAGAILKKLNRRAVQAGWSLNTVLAHKQVQDDLAKLGISTRRIASAVAASESRTPAGAGGVGTGDRAALESAALRLPRDTAPAARPIAERLSDAAADLAAAPAAPALADRLAAATGAPEPQRRALAAALVANGADPAEVEAALGLAGGREETEGDVYG